MAGREDVAQQKPSNNTKEGILGQCCEDHISVRSRVFQVSSQYCQTFHVCKIFSISFSKIQWLTRLGYPPEYIDEIIAEQDAYDEEYYEEEGYYDEETGEWIPTQKTDTEPVDQVQPPPVSQNSSVVQEGVHDVMVEEVVEEEEEEEKVPSPPPTTANAQPAQQAKLDANKAIENDLKAAQEAAKAAGDVAKNLIGGIGGSLLGGLGGGSKKKGGLGGFAGLGGLISGGKPEPAKAQTTSKEATVPTSPPKQEQAVPPMPTKEAHDDLMQLDVDSEWPEDQQPEQDETIDPIQGEDAFDENLEEYGEEEYVEDDQYLEEGMDEILEEEVPDMPVAQDDTVPKEEEAPPFEEDEFLPEDEEQVPDFVPSTEEPQHAPLEPLVEAKDEAIPQEPSTDQTAVISETDPEKSDGKQVAFSEDGKPRFVKHINKTRTMSGRQKWDWAFEKIMQVC